MKNQSFIDHLEELRWKIIISAISVVLFGIAAYCFSDKILAFLLAPLKNQLEQVYFLTPYEAFAVRIEVSLLAGIVFSLPVILYQAWSFVSPGLYRSEAKVVFSAVFVSLALFLAGAAFSFFVVMPTALRFFLGFQTESLKPLISIGKYVAFLAGMVLAFGVTFNLPVVVVVLSRVGIVSARMLARARKHVIVGAFILSAIITPPDVLSQVLLALPLILLFEVSILLAKIVARKEMGGYALGTGSE